MLYLYLTGFDCFVPNTEGMEAIFNVKVYITLFSTIAKSNYKF